MERSLKKSIVNVISMGYVRCLCLIKRVENVFMNKKRNIWLDNSNTDFIFLL